MSWTLGSAYPCDAVGECEAFRSVRLSQPSCLGRASILPHNAYEVDTHSNILSGCFSSWRVSHLSLVTTSQGEALIPRRSPSLAVEPWHLVRIRGFATDLLTHLLLGEWGDRLCQRRSSFLCSTVQAPRRAVPTFDVFVKHASFV